ncbi:MAG: nucleotidyltransferase domain-containing protein, partial [Chloroflexi bacterium]|nr:nucleotidyltransferase domain-containing protein [Chloroflexota bacterium]
MTTTVPAPTIPALRALTWLSASEVAALEAYCDALVRALGREHVKSIILYGSKARGDAHQHSDMDLLVILDPGDEAQQRSECKVVAQINLDFPVRIESFVEAVQLAREMQYVGSPLMQNITRDAIVLLGEELKVNPIDQQKFISDYMNSAREHVGNAELLINNGRYRGAVSDAYYAALDAADAGLIATGTVPKS